MLTRMWRNWNPPTLLMGMKNGAAAMDNGLAVPQKVKCKVTVCMTQQFIS